MAEVEPRYRLGPLERRGYVAGWRAGQVGLVAGCCALAGLVVALSSAGPALAAAGLIVTAGIAGATIPLVGRSVDEWIPSLLAHLRRRGERTLLDVTVIETELEGRDVGVIRHRSGALSCLLALDSSGISLLDVATRAQRVEGMAAALGALAREGGCVDRVGWTASARHVPVAGMLADLRRRGELGTPAAASYRSLLEAVAPVAVNRQVLLSLRSSPMRGAGGEEARTRSLLDEMVNVATALADAGHRRPHPLSADEVVEELRRRHCTVTDDAHVTLHAAARLGELSLEDRRVVTWWVAEWPRHDVTAELLAPLLLADERRVVSVVMEPVRPSAALRRAATAKTSQVADSEMRRRAGFLADRSQQRRGAHVAEREAELVDGHSSLRVAGFVAVEVPEDEDLSGCCAETELAASQARLVLRRLDGDHGRGLVATLPLGGGLT